MPLPDPDASGPMQTPPDPPGRMDTAICLSTDHEAHARPGHVERPERLHAVRATLEADPLFSHWLRPETTPATEDDLRLVHTPDYLDRLRNASEAGGAQLDPDTYATTASYDLALRGAGALQHLTAAVLEGRARNAFAMTRPPGHHARPAGAMGFCLLANIAFAARWARKAFGLERILILDFDVHHGNGTQEIFYDDPHVLFMSLHQFPFYPGTGAVQETGTGRAEGTTVNLPLPAGTGDAGYEAACHRILTPLALRFRPELILVSAGYDAHWHDPLGGMHLSVEGFAEIVRTSLEWAEACCDGRWVAALEGGYHPPTLAYTVLATLHLMHDATRPIHDPLGPSPARDTEIGNLIDDLAHFHRV